TERDLQDIRPADELRKLKVLPEFTESTDFQQLAVAFKRVRNIARELPLERWLMTEGSNAPLDLCEPAERALLAELERRRIVIDRSVETGDGYRDAFAEAAKFKPAVDKFFDDVLVMAPDPMVRETRLRLLKKLEVQIMKLADISAIVPEE